MVTPTAKNVVHSMIRAADRTKGQSIEGTAPTPIWANTRPIKGDLREGDPTAMNFIVVFFLCSLFLADLTKGVIPGEDEASQQIRIGDDLQSIQEEDYQLAAVRSLPSFLIINSISEGCEGEPV